MQSQTKARTGQTQREKTKISRCLWECAEGPRSMQRPAPERGLQKGLGEEIVREREPEGHRYRTDLQICRQSNRKFSTEETAETCVHWLPGGEEARGEMPGSLEKPSLGSD